MNDMAFWGTGSTSAIQALIDEVRKRPVLWNPKHALYHHRTLISDQWDEIADILGASTNLVKTKWKGLRDNFRKEVKKLIKLDKAESPWVHMKHLNFLWTVLDTTQLECNKEKLEQLKEKHNAPKLSEEDSYIISHVRKIDDEMYFKSLEDNLEEDGRSNASSMDFHDFIFADEVPVETFLETNENEEMIFTPDEGLEDEVRAKPNLSPPPLRILNSRSILSSPKSKMAHKRAQIRSCRFKVTQISKKCIAVGQSESEDSDLHFIKSILPYFGQLSPTARKRTHDQVKRIIMHELHLPKKSLPSLIDLSRKENYSFDEKSVSVKKEPESIEP